LLWRRPTEWRQRLFRKFKPSCNQQQSRRAGKKKNVATESIKPFALQEVMHGEMISSFFSAVAAESL
jgi:hypothetical protein